MANATKYRYGDLLVCVQRMNHRMQITQASSKYDSMTNSAKLTKQTSSLLSEDASSLQYYCTPFT